MSSDMTIRVALWRRRAASALPLAAMLLLPVAPAVHAEEALLTPFSSASGAQAPQPWHFTTLPNKPATRFEVVDQDGKRVLKVEADQSYGNLVHPTQSPLNSTTTLAWRWRVDQFVQDADLHTRAGDDGAAKLCVFFDFPIDKLSVTERTKLALARRSLGEEVPSETLCYVWDNKEPKGSEFPNAFTRRIRMIVLESGPAAKPGTWVAERRNLMADYRRAFGDEAGAVLPAVVAVAVSADADNTHGHGLAYFSDLDLRAAPTTQDAGAAPKERPTQGE